MGSVELNFEIKLNYRRKKIRLMKQPTGKFTTKNMTSQIKEPKK